MNGVIVFEKEILFMSDTIWVAYWQINWRGLAPSKGVIGVASTREGAEGLITQAEPVLTSKPFTFGSYEVETFVEEFPNEPDAFEEALVWLDDFADKYDENDQQARSIFYRASAGDKSLSDQEKALALSWLKDACDSDDEDDLAASEALSGLLADSHLG